MCLRSLAWLRAVVEAKDAENQVLRAEPDAARERERRLAELERRLRMDSTDSGHADLEGGDRGGRTPSRGASGI